MCGLVPGRWIAAARWSGAIDFRPILARLGGAAGFLAATPEALGAAGLSPVRVSETLTTQPLDCADPWIHLGASSYPRALLDLSRPPPVLWLRGRASLLQSPGIGVVGTRRCTRYGKTVARRLGAGIARAGGVLVSGAAWGIDAAAHRGALATGQTAAILGAGLEVSPSASAGALHTEILAAGGLLISELPPRDPAQRWTFPRRNRLIAALSRGVVVVEAGERSGALITAERAAELGRPLFAVPGPMDAPASAGTLALIAAGVTCLRSLSPLVELVAAAIPPTDPAARLRRALAVPALPADLARRAGLTLPQVLAMLAMLELTQVVQRLPDSRYVLQ